MSAAGWVALGLSAASIAMSVSSVRMARRARQRFDHLRANHIEQATDPAGATFVDRAVAAAEKRGQTATTPAAPAPLLIWPPAQAPLPPVVMPACTCKRQTGVAHVCRRGAS